MWPRAFAAIALLGVSISPALPQLTARTSGWTISTAQLHEEAGWYYQDGKRRERLGDITGAAEDYRLALKLLPNSSACQVALDRVRNEGAAGESQSSSDPAMLPAYQITTERAMFATLNRALYGSVRDRTRADVEFAGVLQQDDVSIRWKYYSVHGADARQIWYSMERTSSALTNSPDVGLTKWDYQWRAVPETDSHGRRVFNAALTAQITVTMPQWKPSGNEPQDVRGAWQSFYTALSYHEQGHQLIAEFTVAALRLRIDANCRRADPLSISEVCDQVMQDYASLNDQYDQATQHGALQGAVFQY